jgi:hypothetical protein
VLYSDNNFYGFKAPWWDFWVVSGSARYLSSVHAGFGRSTNRSNQLFLCGGWSSANHESASGSVLQRIKKAAATTSAAA